MNKETIDQFKESLEQRRVTKAVMDEISGTLNRHGMGVSTGGSLMVYMTAANACAYGHKKQDVLEMFKSLLDHAYDCGQEQQHPRAKHGQGIVDDDDTDPEQILEAIFGKEVIR